MIDGTVDDRGGVPIEPASWPGLYPGTVVDAADPDKAGKVRVRVDQVYGATTEAEFIPDDQLPWARVLMRAVGRNSGEVWVPPKGAPVVVAFWGSDAEHPVVLGGWPSDAAVPRELETAYGPDPQTRLVQTIGGQKFEMRWKKGDAHTYIKLPSGILLDLVEDPALDGPKVVIETPGQQRVILDDKQMKVTVATPGQIDATAGGAINVTATAAINLTCASLQLNNSGPTAATLTGIITLALLAAFNVVMAGVWTITGAGGIAWTLGGSMSFFAASVLLGGVTAKKLLNEGYHPNVFLPHRHLVPAGTDAAGGVTSEVNQYGPGPGVDVAPATLAAAQTSITKAA